jgi:phage baseplate assembly protein gpV
MSEILPGLYRAEVAATDDPQERGRVRVRLTGMDSPEIPADRLPWAEIGAAFVTTDACDIPHYDIGDRVWVSFEHGLKHMPVVMGGIATNAGGLPALPIENLGDYPETRKRWRRQDRYGNFIELSEVTNERHVKIGSGNASVTVSQRGNRISIQADGPVSVKATSVNVDAAKVSIDGGDVAVEATATFLGTPIPWGVAQLLSNSEVQIGVPMLSNPFGTVNIGQYLDTLLVPRQTYTVNVCPVMVQIGRAVPLLGIPTLTATVDASLQVTIGSLTTLLTSVNGVSVWIGGSTTAVVSVDGVAIALGGLKTATIGLAAPAINVAGALTQTGPTTLTGALALTGAATILGNVSILGNLMVNGVNFSTHVHATAPDGPVSPPT